MAQPSPLRDMIRQARADGRSYAQLASRATDPETGTRFVASQFHAIDRGETRRIPSVPQLRAIAAALDVPYETVQAAAILQWMPMGPEALKALRNLTRQQLAKAEQVRADAERIAAATEPSEDEPQSA